MENIAKVTFPGKTLFLLIIISRYDAHNLGVHGIWVITQLISQQRVQCTVVLDMLSVRSDRFPLIRSHNHLRVIGTIIQTY